MEFSKKYQPSRFGADLCLRPGNSFHLPTPLVQAPVLFNANSTMDKEPFFVPFFREVREPLTLFH